MKHVVLHPQNLYFLAQISHTKILFPIPSRMSQSKITFISFSNSAGNALWDYFRIQKKFLHPSKLDYKWSPGILNTPGNSKNEPRFGNYRLLSQKSFAWVFKKHNWEMGKSWPLDWIPNYNLPARKP